MISRIRNQRGFSLLEVLVSMFLFATVMSGLIPAFASLLRFNTQAQYRTEAISVAQHVLDERRQSDITGLPTSGNQYQSITVDGKQFDAILSYCTVAIYCASSNSRHIRVRVLQGLHEYFATETVFTQLD